MIGDDVYIGDEEGNPKLECAIAWHQYAKEIKNNNKNQNPNLCKLAVYYNVTKIRVFDTWQWPDTSSLLLNWLYYVNPYITNILSKN